MIVAIDPGKISGIATWHDDEFASWEIPCQEAIEVVHGLLELGEDLEAVICEDYLITARSIRVTRGENWSLESIGALRYLCRIFETRFVVQTPADAKRFSTDTKLRGAGWYNPSSGGHRNDAARHLLLYFANTSRLDRVLPSV